MSPNDITRFIADTFPGTDILRHGEDVYIYFDPDRTRPADRRFPFVTIMTSDAYDRASNLWRDGVFRLNIGVGQERFRDLFGDPPSQLGDAAGIDTGHDYTKLDEILPHPVYAAMGWVCILNPSAAAFPRVQELLADAYNTAAAAYDRRAQHLSEQPS